MSACDRYIPSVYLRSVITPDHFASFVRLVESVSITYCIRVSGVCVCVYVVEHPNVCVLQCVPFLTGGFARVCFAARARASVRERTHVCVCGKASL